MPLFEDVKFYCAPSFPPERQAQIAVLLDANGATASPLDQATHIITNASEYEGYQNAKEGVAVVTDSWVDRSLILGKLQQPQYYSPDPAMLFSGVVASSTDIKSTDVEVLSAGITALGGQWKQGLTREVTHLFAACPGSDKYTTALHFQKDTRIKVLVPHWFDDSVRLGIRCLSTSAYEWPDPTALTSGRPPALDDDAARLQSKISGEKKSLFKAALMTTEQEAKLAHVEKRNVWEGRRLLLSSDLDLSDGRRLAVEAGILRSGGVVVEYNEDDEAVEMDVLICRYRSGDLYIQAMNERKLIGSLTWVFHVESTGSISPPSHQLLHYPIPKRPLEGFADHEITVTNYTGEAREYLKKLIVLMGATFTPSMSGKNTVLIAAYISGNKTTKAKNWSIPIVNHTWLEDCFVQWKNLTVGLEKYVVFPAGLDFSEHLVERGVPRAVIAEGLHELLAEIDLSKKSAFDGEGELPGGDGIAPQAPNARDADEGEEDNEIEIAPMDVDDFDDDDTSPLATAAPEDDGMEVDTPPEMSSPTRARQPPPAPPPKRRPSSARKKQKQEASPARARGRNPGEAAADGGARRSRPRTKAVSPSKRAAQARAEGEPQIERAGPSPRRTAVDESGEEEEESPSPVRRSTRTNGQRSVPDGVPEEADTMAEAEAPGSPRRKLSGRAKPPSKTTRSKKAAPAKELAISPSKLPGRGTGPPRSKREMPVEPEASDGEESVSPRKTSGRSKGSYKGKVTARSEEEDDDDDDEVVVIISPPRKTYGRQKGAPRRKSTALAEVSDPDEDELPEDKTARHPKTKASKQPVSDDTDEEADRDDQAHGSSKSRRAAPLRVGKPVLATPSKSSKMPDRPAALTPRRTISVLLPPVGTALSLTSPGNPSPKKAGPSSSRVLAGLDSRHPHTTSVGASTSRKRENAVAVDTSIDHEMDTSFSRLTSRRSAANKATQRLRDEVMPDLVNFEKEMKRGHVRGAGDVDQKGKSKPAAGPDPQITSKRRLSERAEDAESPEEGRSQKKRRLSAAKGKSKTAPVDEESVAGSDSQDGDEAQGKGAGAVIARRKKPSPDGDTEGATPSKPVRIMTTQVTLSEDVMRALTKLGAKIAARPSDCTHLIVKSLGRTEKFLCAMAVAPHIVTEKWATASAAAQKFLPPEKYRVVDPENEKKFEFKLADALHRATQNKGRIFADMVFFVTPNVPVERKLLKNVVAAHGGQMRPQNPTVRALNGKSNYFVISCPEDASIWKPLADAGHPIYTKELLLNGALTQEIRWDDPSSRLS